MGRGDGPRGTIIVRRFAALGLALTLAGCQTTPTDPLVWVRTDGQRASGNPALEQQYQIDSTICLGQRQQSAANMDPVYYRGLVGAMQADMIQNQRTAGLDQVIEGCMAQRGYVHVPASQAAATAASFASTHRQRAAIAPKS